MSKSAAAASAAALLHLLAAPGARAEEPDVAAIEHLFGATLINAAIGNGGATAAFSAQGEMTVLRWPSPSYYQHVNHKTSTAKDARQMPHFGARDNHGSFAGVYVSATPGGGPPAFSWVRDGDWMSTQRYASHDSNRLITVMTSAALGLTVTYTDVVAPDVDVLSRRIEVRPVEGFTPQKIKLAYFENFSPVMEKIDFYPTDQYNLLDSRDYALVMSQQEEALIHFSVKGRPAALVAPLASAATRRAVDDFLAAEIADNPATEGMYIVVGSDPPPDGYHCGNDLATPPAGAPADAYDEMPRLLLAGGSAAGSPAALQNADGALSWDLPPTGGAVEVFIGMGASYRAAVDAFTSAHHRGGDAVRAADETFWRDWLKGATLPATDDMDTLRIAKRALLSIAVGRDRASGAIVASVSAQPPYSLDWPRDGAFLNYALDLAGYPAWVEQHNLFYTRMQRKFDGEHASTGQDTPAGSFAMNYYADGRPGGPWPFEIDEVGFAMWSWYEHAKWIPEKEREPYLEKIYPSMVLAADLLTDRCVDAATRLQCLANEDDNATPTITLHGSITVRLGLASAVRTAHFLGHLADARRWRARLLDLDAAIEQAYGDPVLGYVGAAHDLPDVGGTGPVAWTLWPGEFHPFDDPRMKLAAAQIEAAYIPFFTQMSKGGAYFGKGLVALARFHAPTTAGGTGDAAGQQRVRDWLDVMVKQVATPNTGHFGESFVHDGGGRYTNVVAIPHLWEACLTYLSLLAAYNPDAFARPELASLDVPPPSSGGCETRGGAPPAGEGGGGGRGWAAVAVALLLLGAIVVRRRARA